MKLPDFVQYLVKNLKIVLKKLLSSEYHRLCSA